MPLTKVDEKEKSRVLEEIQIERDWHKDSRSFKSISEIRTAVDNGVLIKVQGDDNYLPIMRYRNPNLENNYPPYLSKPCKEILDIIGKLWREEMIKNKLSRDIKFAVTSLTRTQEYQKELVKAGKLADPNSVHCKGWAFDIDASGYYDGKNPINPRVDLQKKFVTAFRGLGILESSPSFKDYIFYNPLVHKLLKEVLERLLKEGKIHFVHEFPNTGNDVFHVCGNPNP